MDANVFTIIGLVAGFFLLGFISAWAWYNNQLTKLYEEFCDKVDKACDEVAKYYEHKLQVQEQKLKSIGEKPEEKERIEQYRDWLKTQYNKEGTISSKICFVKQVLTKCQSDKNLLVNERSAMKQFNKWLGIENYVKIDLKSNKKPDNKEPDILEVN